MMALQTASGRDMNADDYAALGRMNEPILETYDELINQVQLKWQELEGVDGENLKFLSDGQR